MLKKKIRLLKKEKMGWRLSNTNYLKTLQVCQWS